GEHAGSSGGQAGGFPGQLDRLASALGPEHTAVTPWGDVREPQSRPGSHFVWRPAAKPGQEPRSLSVPGADHPGIRMAARCHAESRDEVEIAPAVRIPNPGAASARPDGCLGAPRPVLEEGGRERGGRFDAGQDLLQVHSLHAVASTWPSRERMVKSGSI